MKISKDIWNHTWKLALTVAVAVGGYFGFAPGSDESQNPEQATNSFPRSTTGIKGDININNNYSPQPSIPQTTTQSNQENDLDSKATSQTISSNTDVEINGDGNINGDNNTDVNGSHNIIGNDNNVDNSKETINIKEQTNTERNTQAEQYNENNGSSIVNCNNNNDSCVENYKVNDN